MIVGICMVKDEIDVVQAVFERNLKQCDRIIALDNGSTDGTREVLGKLDRVEAIDDPRIGHRYREVVTMLARKAFEEGATKVVPFDADEVIVGPLRDRLHRSYAPVVNVPIWDHVIAVSDNPMKGPIQRMGWRRHETFLYRVIFRPTADCEVADGGHTVRYDDGPWLRGDGLDRCSIHHFPVRSYEQFERKAQKARAALKDVTRWEGDSSHWVRYARELRRGKLRELFDAEFVSLTPRASGLVWEPIE